MILLDRSGLFTSSKPSIPPRQIGRAQLLNNGINLVLRKQGTHKMIHSQRERYLIPTLSRRSNDTKTSRTMKPNDDIQGL